MENSLTKEQIIEIKNLIETSGFLPMTNKADRLFAMAEAKSKNAELPKLREMFKEAGYLPRSKALKLVELASS